MKKVAVVGGLGYVGSHLVSKIETKYDVRIYDIDCFGSPFVPMKADFSRKNFVDVSMEEFDEYDCIVVCSDIDIGEFYDDPAFEQYVRKYADKIFELDNMMECKTIWVNGGGDCSYMKFVRELDNRINDHHVNGNVYSIKCPQLYGGNQRVRTDLYINNVLIDFIQYRRYIVEGDILDKLRFTHVSLFTNYLETMIGALTGDVNNQLLMQIDEDYEETICEVNKFNICNYIQWMLGPDYELYVNPGENMELDGYHTHKFDQSNEMTHTMKMFMKLFGDGKNTELFNMNSDNRYIVNNSIIGKRFLQSILDA